MTFFFRYGLILFITLLNSCVNNDASSNDAEIKDNEAEISLSIYAKDKFDKNASPANFIKDAQVVKLKTSPDPNSIVAEAGKVFFINARYYIWDKKFSGIKVFDADGNFLFQIGKIGKGPAEFVKIFDVDVIDSSMIVMLCDAVKLEYYDLSGNYIKSTALGMFASSFSLVSSNKFLFYIGNNFSEKSKNCNLILTDTNINVLNRYFASKTNEDIAAFAYTGFLVKGIDKPLYSMPFDDKIYAFAEGSFQVKYKFDLGKNKLPDEIIQNNTRSRSRERSEANYIGNELFETEKYLFFTFKKENRIEYGILDKETNSINIRSSIEDANDYLGGLFYVPLGGVKDTIIIGVQPEKIIYLKEKQRDYVESIRNINGSIYGLIKSYQLTDNFVLLKCAVK